MHKLSIFCALLTAVTACSTKPEAVMKTKDSAIPVTLSSAATKPVGYHSSRASFRDKAGLSGKSIAAPCSIKSEWFTVRFTSTAQVNLPTWGKNSPPAVFSCEYNGSTYSEKLAIVNLSQQQRSHNNAAVAAGLFGIVGAIAAPTGKEKEGDAYAYYVPPIILEK